MTSRPPPITIRVENLRALTEFEWTPSGVCALVGPNGSGKSTALVLVELAHRASKRGMPDAIGSLFGTGVLRSLHGTNTAPTISLSAAGAEWRVVVDRHARRETGLVDGHPVWRELAFTPSGTQMELIFGGQDKVFIHRERNLVIETLESVAAEHPVTQRLAPILNTLRRSHYFAHPAFDSLRGEGSQLSGDVVLDTNAANLFAVLHAWYNSSDHEHRYAFVRERMLSIFKNDFRRFDFEFAGQRVSASVVPRFKEKLKPTDWADGFFACLVHLVALASCDPGGIVAIDEPENSLHPALIRQLITAMRDWSAEHDVTVVCATHSPVVLDQFSKEPEQIYVMERGHAQLPVPLDHLKKREWLAHYALGDLYAHSEVGAPT